jgi:hypothetical protein
LFGTLSKWRGVRIPRRVTVRFPRNLFERALNNASFIIVHGPNDQVFDLELPLLPIGERQAFFLVGIGEKILVLECGVGFAKPRSCRMKVKGLDLVAKEKPAVVGGFKCSADRAACPISTVRVPGRFQMSLKFV